MFKKIIFVKVSKEESSEESSDEDDEEESPKKSVPVKRKTEDNSEEVELKIKKPNNNYNNFVKAGQNSSFNEENVSFHLFCFCYIFDISFRY